MILYPGWRSFFSSLFCYALFQSRKFCGTFFISGLDFYLQDSCSDEKLDAVCDQYADCKALTYELTHAFISAVYIYDLDNIEIVWKFKDFLNTPEGEAK